MDVVDGSFEGFPFRGWFFGEPQTRAETDASKKMPCDANHWPPLKLDGVWVILKNLFHLRSSWKSILAI